MKIKSIAILVVTAVCFLTPLSASADQISDQIQRALKLYQQGKLTQAMDELQFALAEMRRKKASALPAVFPPPPAGWKAKKAKFVSGGVGIMAAGSQASREYYQDGGRGRAHMELTTDSPMLQGLAMMMSNPMLLQASGQGRLVRIRGQKALLKPTGNGAELQWVIDGKVLLLVRVSNTPQAESLAQELAGKLDLAKLRELAK
jgi:hypothetical protein